MVEFTYEIIEHIVTLSTSDKNWSKELNKVSWNGKEPVLDIRLWNETHDKMSKGISLTSEELQKLKEVI